MPIEHVIDPFITFRGVAVADVIIQIVSFDSVIGGDFLAATVKYPFIEERMQLPNHPRG